MRVVLLLFALLSVCWAGENTRSPEEVNFPHVKIAAGPLTEEEVLAVQRQNRNTASLKFFSPANRVKPIYNIPNDLTLGTGYTIAIVDAFGYSSAEYDLRQFSIDNGLPYDTTKFFKKVDQYGGTNYPADDASASGAWATEAALDVQAVHLFAPGANILLVVTNSASDADLYAGVQYAAAHAQYVSMSWGAKEGTWAYNHETLFRSYSSFVSFFASTGDNGFPGGVEYPSSSQYVVAVGGTSVYTLSDYSFSSELGWSGSVGGCSAITAAIPEQQSSFGYSSLGCNGYKAVPDISSLADPNSGIMIVMSQSNRCRSPPCRYAVGGTSLAAPLTAARAAIRGAHMTPAYVYTSNIAIRDITLGNNNGKNCQNGLDLVTGRGSWIGSY